MLSILQSWLGSALLWSDQIRNVDWVGRWYLMQVIDADSIFSPAAELALDLDQDAFDSVLLMEGLILICRRRHGWVAGQCWMRNCLLELGQDGIQICDLPDADEPGVRWKAAVIWVFGQTASVVRRFGHSIAGLDGPYRGLLDTGSWICWFPGHLDGGSGFAIVQVETGYCCLLMMGLIRWATVIVGCVAGRPWAIWMLF
ncbi:hypothetical protein ACLOJK_004210 [Asimina triloba]